MPRNVICDQCEKEIGDEKLAWFSDVENDLDFCSKECKTNWNTENNWKVWQESIHQNFTSELHKVWKERELFSYQECKEWIEIGLKPNDANFTYWLKNTKQVNAEWVKNNGYTFRKNQRNYDLLREEYQEYKSKSVKAQEWLDKNYPKGEREKIKKIYLVESSLEGELDLGDFTELKEVYVSLVVDKTKLDLKNLSEYAKVKKYTNAQEYINKWYPKKHPHKERKKGIHEYYLIKERGEVTELNIYNELEGSLDLSDFVNLEELDLNDNLLNSVTLPSNHTNLTTLWLSNNNFPKQDLSFLVPYTNLKVIFLGNYDYCREKINQGIYNKFTGSLDYLSGMKQLKTLSIGSTDISEVNLIKFSTNLEWIDYSVEERPNCKLTQIIPQIQEYEWKSIHPKFTLENRRGWEKSRFTKEQIEKWIEVGTEPKDYKFVSWLKEVKKFSPKEFLDNKNDGEYKEIKEKCNKFNWCRKCQQPNSSPDWCQPCQEEEWQEDIKQLSGQEVIEKFAQKQELKVGEDYKGISLEWIPYEEFSEIKHLADGGFSKVYKVKWSELLDRVWKDDELEESSREVILKVLNDSQNITLEFLQEISNTKLVDDEILIVTCYGVSQDYTTKNYAIVMEYIEEGSLRQYLSSHKELSFEIKLHELLNIVNGLKSIHDRGLIHRDLHLGNILWRGICHITDLGLSQPAGFQKKEDKIFGVLPYVAPEVLQGRPYTQASDIYSFGIVAYEILANSYPYLDLIQDGFLAAKICQGLRPNIDELKAPQSLKDLIEKCWDVDCQQRPTVIELQETIENWYKYDEEEINSGELKEDTEFYQQYLEIEEEHDYFPQSTSYKIHPTAIITSRPIDTKQIIKLLETEQTSSQLTKIIEKIKEKEEVLKELKKPLSSELVELVDKFIEIQKKSIKEGENDEITKLKEEMKEKSLSRKKRDEFIRHCEDLINLEQQKQQIEEKQTKLQTNIEIPTKK